MISVVIAKKPIYNMCTTKQFGVFERMRKVVLGRGFLLSFLIHFLFRYEWGLIAMMLLAFHFSVGLSAYYCFIPLIIWVLHALIVTLVYRAISRIPSDIHKKRPNRNPYSKSTSDYIVNDPQNSQAKKDDVVIDG